MCEIQSLSFLPGCAPKIWCAKDLLRYELMRHCLIDAIYFIDRFTSHWNNASPWGFTNTLDVHRMGVNIMCMLQLSLSPKKNSVS